MSTKKISDKTINIHVCRICLASNSDHTVIIKKQNGWLSMFEYCFGIILTTKDEARRLCDQCASKVKIYSDFKKQCLKSDNLWKSVVNVKCSVEKISLKRSGKIEDNEIENNDIDNDLKDDDLTQPKYKKKIENDTGCFNNDRIISSAVKNEDDVYTNIYYLEEYDTNICLENEMENLFEKTDEIYIENLDENDFFEEKDKSNIKIKILDKNESIESLHRDNINSNEGSLEEIKVLVENTIEKNELFQEKDKSNIENLENKESLESLDQKNKNFKDEDSVKDINKMLNLTKEKQDFICKICHKSYGNKKWYLKHSMKCKLARRKGNNENIGTLTVSSLDICPKTLKNNNSEVIYENNPMFFCGLCKLSFQNKNETYEHINEHWSNNNLQCKLCDHVGSDVAASAAHRYIHYPPIEKYGFYCHICPRKKVSRVALEFHYRQVHLKKKGGLCSKCHKEIDTLRSWKKHEKRHGIGSFICDICGRRFNFKHEIRRHILEQHMRLNQERHMCDTCGNTYSRARYLNLHVDTVHATDPITCKHCNRIFKNQYRLNYHLKMLAKEKLVKCEVCFEAFHNFTALKSHMVKHSNARPYCCHICGTRFKAKCALRQHLNSHAGYRPYKCEICSKGFLTSFRLKVHSAVHTGIRRHKCCYCTRTFNDSVQLRIHCAKSHKIESVKNIK